MSEKVKNIKINNLTQLGLGLVIIVLLNIIGSFIFTRFDLTTEKRYSLSQATKDLLKDLDDVVYFKVYLEGDFPAGFKRLSKSTRELLDEFRAYSNRIQYEFINPSKVGDPAEVNAFYDELVQSGLNPTDLKVRKKDGTSQQIIFPGALVTYKNRTLPLELLQTQIGMPPEAVLNNSIQALEYNISSIIRRLSSTKKPKIAFIKGHGELDDIYIADIVRSLSEFYQVEPVEIDEKLSSLTKRDTTSQGNLLVRNTYEAIIFAKPDSAFSEKDKFIIDQYVMRGGKILWLIDPLFASMDSLEYENQTIGLARDLNITDMLFKYGVRINNDLVMDLNSLPIRVVTGMIGDQPQISFYPWFFFPVVTPVSTHPIVKNLNSVKTEFVSSIDTLNNKGVKKTILLETSRYSRTQKSPVLISLKILEEEPDERLYSQSYQTIAVLLEGNFQSVFTNRIPPEIADNTLVDFQEVSLTNKMIVIADGDIIRNQLHYTQGYPLPLGFDQYTRQNFGNRDLILNAVNYLCDDSGLISARSKELTIRLLNQTKIENERLFWQSMNVFIPVFIILIFAILQFSLRKRKYARQL